MSARLGEFFPAEFIARQADDCIRPGAVFRIYITTTTPPKIKRIVIVGVSQEEALIGHLLINSDGNWYQIDSDELRNLQIYLDSDSRDYLDHSSYLDCSSLFTLPMSTLKEHYLADPSILLGNLCPEDLAGAIEKTTSAPTITKKDKKKFGLV